MELYIKNKIFSLRGSSTVNDENGNPHYFVKGKVFSLRRKKQVQNAEGKLLYGVQNRFFNLFLHAAYITDANGQKILRVRRKFSLVHRSFTVEGFGGDQYRIDGDFFGFDFLIYRNNLPVGGVHKKFFALTDQYILNADKAEDMAFLVALVVAIDNIKDKEQQDANNND